MDQGVDLWLTVSLYSFHDETFFFIFSLPFLFLLNLILFYFGWGADECIGMVWKMQRLNKKISKKKVKIIILGIKYGLLSWLNEKYYHNFVMLLQFYISYIPMLAETLLSKLTYQSWHLYHAVNTEKLWGKYNKNNQSNIILACTRAILET